MPRAIHTGTTDHPLWGDEGNWHIQPRGQSGVFIASTRGTLLCRYDSGSGLIHLWDKKGGCEVTITLADLNHLHEVTRTT